MTKRSTPKLSSAEKAAVNLLNCMATRREKYDAVNETLRSVSVESPPQVQFIDDAVEAHAVALASEILGLDDIASYYLYECVGKYGHGGGITCCSASKKRPWKLRNAKELERYVIHAKCCRGMKGKAA